MKDYEEKVINIMDSAKDSIRTQLDKAYKSGYEDAKSELGQDAIDLAHEESDRAYQQGLEDAWEAAKWLYNNEVNLAENIFNCEYWEIYSMHTVQEVVYKIKEHKDKQKQDTIQVGDEVDYHGDKYIVTLIADGGYTYTAISADGSHILRASRDDITFTGRHFDAIAEVLAEMRGESE